MDPYRNNFPAEPLEVSLLGMQQGVVPTENRSSDQGGGDSPAIAWGELPDAARSVLVTMFDPDAPVPGGFWHWLVVAPASAAGLSGGASGRALPDGARELPNSFGVSGYVGPNPPAGTGEHTYYVAVTALSSEVKDLPDAPSTAMLHAAVVPLTLARGTATVTAAAL